MGCKNFDHGITTVVRIKSSKIKKKKCEIFIFQENLSLNKDIKIKILPATEQTSDSNDTQNIKISWKMKEEFMLQVFKKQKYEQDIVRFQLDSLSQFPRAVHLSG